MNYKHGDTVRQWRYRHEYVPNPKWTKGAWFQKEFNYVQTNEKVYFGEVYRFRYDPISQGHKYGKGGWSKYDGNKGSGKCWKREWYAARVDAKEVFYEYGITFKNSDRINYKYCTDWQKGWKRSKKKKQWM